MGCLKRSRLGCAGWTVVVAGLSMCLSNWPAHASQTLTIAAASQLKTAMDQIVAGWKVAHPKAPLNVVYGSSGKLQTQIRNGAPFDLFFSADVDVPKALADDGFSASGVTTYAFGRLVLWSATADARTMTLASLTHPFIARIALANPKHAPYGRRAEEALRASGVWSNVESKLVYGESVAQAAQFVQTGNAQVGIIALAQALSPEIAKSGGYWLVPDELHKPLEQGFIITKRAAANVRAKDFAVHMSSPEVHSILVKFGYALPACPPPDQQKPSCTTKSLGHAERK